MTQAGAVTPLVSDEPGATAAIGRALGVALRAGDVVELDGPLGAGKTCLVRGLVDGAGGEETAVRSPTFALHQPHRAGRLTIHHIDLYRLGAGADIRFLELDELLIDGAAVIEWGEYADLTPWRPLRIELAVLSEEGRLLTIAGEAPPHLAAAWAGSGSGPAR